jgi:hypothetical protein
LPPATASSSAKSGAPSVALVADGGNDSSGSQSLARGLVITTVKDFGTTSIGVVNISVPEVLAQNFVFDLPKEFLLELAKNSDRATATQIDGSSLPSWIRFDGDKLRFSANSVPSDGLPFTAQVTIGSKRIIVEVQQISGQ